MSENFPRRCSLEKMTKEELAIREAILQIESLGCHPALTEVVIALGNAKDKLSDWVDAGMQGGSK